MIYLLLPLILLAFSLPVLPMFYMYFKGTLPCVASGLGLCGEAYVIPFTTRFVDKECEHTCLYKNLDTLFGEENA